jgi:hypothetical protein
MKTDQLETMMSMLLEGGDMVSVLDPIPPDLLPGTSKPMTAGKKNAAGCSDAKEECCELV